MRTHAHRTHLRALAARAFAHARMHAGTQTNRRSNRHARTHTRTSTHTHPAQAVSTEWLVSAPDIDTAKHKLRNAAETPMATMASALASAKKKKDPPSRLETLTAGGSEPGEPAPPCVTPPVKAADRPPSPPSFAWAKEGDEPDRQPSVKKPADVSALEEPLKRKREENAKDRWAAVVEDLKPLRDPIAEEAADEAAAIPAYERGCKRLAEAVRDGWLQEVDSLSLMPEERYSLVPFRILVSHLLLSALHASFWMPVGNI